MRLAAGRLMVSIASRFMARLPLRLQRGPVEPLAAAPALQPELGELHAFCALHQSPAEGSFARDVLQVQLPLRLECIAPGGIVGLFLPAFEKLDRLRDVGILYRFRCCTE